MAQSPRRRPQVTARPRSFSAVTDSACRSPRNATLCLTVPTMTTAMKTGVVSLIMYKMFK